MGTITNAAGEFGQTKSGSQSLARRISVFEPPPSETPSTKPQAPEKSRNRNTKNQAPNTKDIPSSKLQTAAGASSLELLWSLELGVWCLRPGASLELGVWNLELVAWARSFSKIAMRPRSRRSRLAWPKTPRRKRHRIYVHDHKVLFGDFSDKFNVRSNSTRAVWFFRYCS